MSSNDLAPRAGRSRSSRCRRRRSRSSGARTTSPRPKRRARPPALADLRPAGPRAGARQV